MQKSALPLLERNHHHHDNEVIGQEKEKNAQTYQALPNDTVSEATTTKSTTKTTTVTITVKIRVQSTVEYPLSMPLRPLIKVILGERRGRRRQRRIRYRPRSQIILRVHLELTCDLLLHRRGVVHIIGSRRRDGLSSGVARVPAYMGEWEWVR